MARKKQKFAEEYLTNIARLEFAGHRTHTAAEITLLLKQVVEPRENRVVELESTLMAYVILLQIANGPEELTVTDFELRMPWEDSRLCWLPEPTQSKWNHKYYRFSSRLGLRYEEEDTLNQLIDGSPLQRWETKFGVLLGVGCPIPGEFKHGDSIDGRLALVDQFGRPHFTRIELLLDRETCLPYRRATTERRHSLYEKDEPAPGVSVPLPTSSGDTPTASQDLATEDIGRGAEAVAAGGCRKGESVVMAQSHNGIKPPDFRSPI